MVSRPTHPTLFPYTTLFRSEDGDRAVAAHVDVVEVGLENLALGVAGVEDDGHERFDDLAFVRALAGQEDHRSVHGRDRKSTRLNSSHGYISYAVFCLK